MMGLPIRRWMSFFLAKACAASAGAGRAALALGGQRRQAAAAAAHLLLGDFVGVNLGEGPLHKQRRAEESDAQVRQLLHARTGSASAPVCLRPLGDGRHARNLPQDRCPALLPHVPCNSRAVLCGRPHVARVH